MKHTLSKTFGDRRWTREEQLQRIRAVIDHELTPLQKQTMIQYYFYHFTIAEIARMRGVHKSAVFRTLHRAEEKLKKYLQY